MTITLNSLLGKLLIFISLIFFLEFSNFLLFQNCFFISSFYFPFIFFYALGTTTTSVTLDIVDLFMVIPCVTYECQVTLRGQLELELDLLGVSQCSLCQGLLGKPDGVRAGAWTGAGLGKTQNVLYWDFYT